MLHVRALIKADTVILFDAAPALFNVSSDNSDQSNRVNRLKSRLQWHIQGNLKALRREEKNSKNSSRDEFSTHNSGLLQTKNLSYEHRLAPLSSQLMHVLTALFLSSALESILISVANALEEELTYTR